MYLRESIVTFIAERKIPASYKHDVKQSRSKGIKKVTDYMEC